ncbi:MAG: thermonuclease family protein [Hyphomicrobium sp.]
MSESVRMFACLRPVAFALAVVVSGAAAPTPPAAAAAKVVSGRASAVDGDTLDVAGVRVRLEGIDAPENAQTCGRSGPRSWLGSMLGSWPCGRKAQRALADLVGSAEVTCESRGHDKYGRMLGVCSVDGRDLNAAMVRSGMAWAFVKYSKAYVVEEAVARSAGAGIWQGEAEPAWVYREKRWASAEETAPAGCAIKGNVTGKGHIYHLPWSPWYTKVKVETGKGERWFCSESEAMAAGWRPAVIN